MDEMKIRGFTTPEDFSGTDSEKIQQAVNTAIEKDIRKVVISGKYTLKETVVLPPYIHLVLTGAEITSNGDFPAFMNENITKDKFYHCFSFEEDMFYLEGGKIKGDISFYNAYRVVIDNMEIEGGLDFEFSNEVRLTNLKIEGKNGVNIKRGSNNFICDNVKITAENNGFTIDTADTKRDYVVGKSADIHDLIIKNSNIKATCGFSLEAGEKTNLFNIVIEDNSVAGTPLELSKREGELAPSHYRDITAVGFNPSDKNGIKLFSDTKHCLIG